MVQASAPTTKLKTVRIPLVGSYNQRDIDGSEILSLNKDQRFLNCLFEIYEDPVTGGKKVYVLKRPGWEQDLIVDAGESSTGLIKPQSFSAVLSAFGSTNSIIYLGSVSVGTITGIAIHFTEVIAGTTTYIMIRSSDGTGWFFAEDANADLTYVGDTNTNTIIDNLDSTTGMYVGQEISGTNIVAGTRIESVDSATQITVDTATTGTSVGVTITKTPIAKITDPDFVETGEAISAFESMNGYVYYTTDDGNVRNSDLNSVTSWPATGLLAVHLSPDPPNSISRYRDKIVVFGTSSKESFNDVGNDTGSPLQRWSQDFEEIGVLDQRSLIKLENDIYFISPPRFGDIGVYKTDGLHTEKISTSFVDKILGTVSTSAATIYASSFKLGGQSYIGLTLSTSSEEQESLLLESGDLLLLEDAGEILLEGDPASLSSFVRFLVYNVALKHWSEWDLTKATFVQGSVVDSGNKLIASSRIETDGKLYKLDSTSPVYADDGTSYTAEIRTSKVDFGTQNRKFIHKIRLVGDTQSAGEVLLSWADDDYGTYSTARTFDLTKTNPELVSCGSHKGGRVYKLQHTSANPFRAEALEFVYSEGTK
jgi:hypothetical protein